MVPTIASSGGSFQGAAAYYLHDKDADTAKRVAWTHTENLLTDDPNGAWKVMAWTAAEQATLKTLAGGKMTGRKLIKPVFAFSVAWHPEQRPDREHMLAAAKAAAAAIGLAEHQAIYVSHSDEPQSHVHVLVNRVHPDTGLAAPLSRSREKLQAWALAYEREHGKVYCQGRERNARRRATPVAERDQIKPEHESAVQSAWRRSDSGRSFQAALKTEGLTLAQGNRRLVVVDRYGKAVNPVRELPGVKAAAFKVKLKDLDLAALPTAASVQRQARVAGRKEYHAARQHDAWAAEYLNKAQDRQTEERAAMNARYHKQLTERKEELARHYKMVELRAAVDALRERSERAGLLRKLTGAAAKDRAELVARERQLADVERRTAEQLGAVTTQWDYARSDMADRHARETVLAREHVAEQRPTAYAEERVPEVGRSSSSGRAGGRGRDDGGREREMYRTARLVPAFAG